MNTYLQPCVFVGPRSSCRILGQTWSRWVSRADNQGLVPSVGYTNWGGLQWRKVRTLNSEVLKKNGVSKSRKQSQREESGSEMQKSLRLSKGCASQTGDLVFTGVFVRVPRKTGSHKTNMDHLPTVSNLLNRE